MCLERVTIGRLRTSPIRSTARGGPGGLSARPRRVGHADDPRAHQWAGLLRAMGDPEWARAEWCATPAGRMAHMRRDRGAQERLGGGTDPQTRSITPRRPRARRPRRSATSPRCSPGAQPRSRGFFREIDHPRAGRLQHPTTPYRFSKTPWVGTRAPLLGEHDDLEVDDRGSARASDAIPTPADVRPPPRPARRHPDRRLHVGVGGAAGIAAARDARRRGDQDRESRPARSFARALADGGHAAGRHRRIARLQRSESRQALGHLEPAERARAASSCDGWWPSATSRSRTCGPACSIASASATNRSAASVRTSSCSRRRQWARPGPRATTRATPPRSPACRASPSISGHPDEPPLALSGSVDLRVGTAVCVRGAGGAPPPPAHRRGTAHRSVVQRGDERHDRSRLPRLRLSGVDAEAHRQPRRVDGAPRLLRCVSRSDGEIGTSG